jgi:hypothetical protein
VLGLLLHSAPTEAASDAPPWWFFVAIVLVILAAALFMMRLALSSGRRRRRRAGAACPACGARVQAGWVRCPSCGGALGRGGGAQSGAGIAAAAPHVGPAVIEFTSGPLAGRSYPLEREVTTIGSVEGNTVVLQDTGVSRKHVGIRKVDGGFELADLGSTNGVFVNGEKSARRRLVSGDVVRIGTSEARFKG